MKRYKKFNTRGVVSLARNLMLEVVVSTRPIMAYGLFGLLTDITSSQLKRLPKFIVF